MEKMTYVEPELVIVEFEVEALMDTSDNGWTDYYSLREDVTF